MKSGRPYLYEVVLAVNFAVIAIIAPRQVLGTLGDAFRSVLPLAIPCVGVGVAIRLAIAYRRRTLRRLLTVFRSRRWLIDTLRLELTLVLLTQTYGWIKLLIPILHPRLYDRELFEIDKAMFGGASPTVFLLTLFSNSTFLRFIDRTYANIFVVSLLIATTYFLSSPRARLRIAYMTSNVVLWLTGAWLYVLVPSLGPAYRFPAVWLEYANQLVLTQQIQATLMRNYRAVLRLAQGQSASVSVVYGIAAFPSLHVGYQVLVALWMRREWLYGEIVFGIFAFFILIGSMITGWHYFVDGIAGAALALLAYLAGTSLMRLKRQAATRR